MLRRLRTEIYGLLTLAGLLGGGCGGSRDPAEGKGRLASLDALPAYAVSAKGHVGSLAVHSFTREGGDQQPAPSPDGAWFAFVSTRNSTQPQIYRQPSSGSVVTQLTRGPGEHIQPAVSPDGREIAFAGREAGQWDIWIIPAGGGARENLTATPELDEVSPTWHRSGRLLAFGAKRAGRDGEWWVCAKARGATGVSWITPGQSPNWSPKGDLIAFRRARERGRREFAIWVVKVAVDANGLVGGGAESQIVSNPGWGAVEPAFSPDGERIAFTAVGISPESGSESRPSGGDIWCVRTDGADLTRLTETPEADWDPAWAGTADDPRAHGRIFFASERNRHMNVWSLLPGLSGPPAPLAPVGQE